MADTDGAPARAADRSDKDRFDIIVEALGLPAAGILPAEIGLIDREAASVRVLRLDQPVEAHLHRGCDEYLYVVSGRGTAWAGDPAREAEFGPGQLLVFARGTAHALPAILAGPLILLSIDTPRRAPTDIVPVDPATGQPRPPLARPAPPLGDTA